MKHIAASTKVRGKPRQWSIEAARRRVRDGERYLIQRHGAWFRPDAHGYTTEIVAAGIFDADTARGYLDVEGLAVVPLRSISKVLRARITELQGVLDRMVTMLKEAGR